VIYFKVLSLNSFGVTEKKYCRLDIRQPEYKTKALPLQQSVLFHHIQYMQYEVSIKNNRIVTDLHDFQ
jgi:hypothetical protein